MSRLLINWLNYNIMWYFSQFQIFSISLKTLSSIGLGPLYLNSVNPNIGLNSHGKIINKIKNVFVVPKDLYILILVKMYRYIAKNGWNIGKAQLISSHQGFNPIDLSNIY